MSKKVVTIILVGLFAVIFPLSAHSEGIPLQKDILLATPIFGPEDLPEEITFNLYDSQNAMEPIGSQTFQRGQYNVDFEFSKSDGITADNVARINATFTNQLAINSEPESASNTKEIWAGIEVAGTEIGDRTKVSDETLVQLLLASDASIASYLTLAYTGDANPITTIYKNLPISSLTSNGYGLSLSDYFKTVTVGVSEGLIEPNSVTYPSDNILLDNNKSLQIATTGGSSQNVVRLNSSNNVLMGAPNTGQMQFWDGGDQNVVITGNGDVGIGVAVPEARLQVSGGHILLDNNQALRVKRSDGTAQNVFRISSSDDMLLAAPSGGQVQIWDGGQRNLTITGAGHIGVGTTNPGTYRLAVEGSIGCRELTVTTAAWADFVFEDGYKLPSLREIEDFISENKHLPGIPSEAQVKKYGISVGEINSKFLQKIEELTLYVIDINKENASLKAQLAKLEAQLKEIKN